MNNNSNSQFHFYTVVLEQHRDGFILYHLPTFKEAREFAKKAFNAVQHDELLEYMLLHGVAGSIARYTINGNCMYTGNTSWEMCDGFNNISVVKVEFKEHWLEDFIKERENASHLFNPFKGYEEDKELAEFVEKFDRNVFWAN